MAMLYEYIWVDGTKPTQKLRSKTKVLHEEVEQLPEWNFDGSSTYQATGNSSDLILKPVFVCDDPTRVFGKLVLCEVLLPDGTPHPTNTRAKLREVAEMYAAHEPWFGIEQEYTMFRDGRPLGWPERGYPAPQGPFYCGVGADEVFGREVAEEHLHACLESGLQLSGLNAEVMPGQWEYQIGPLGALEVSDQLLISRWLMYRIAEDHDVVITLDPKPVRGDWNGAGGHTNFSTKAMREDGGIEAIHAAIAKLEKRHSVHVENYGAGIENRLTGLHETCSYKEFRSGIGDRGASIRIPLHCGNAGKGYLEDRRPCANLDPYVVTRLLIETCCT